ncbi:hypothetical protein AN286_06535 [Aliarcobacter cryaerophilus ATCC 43158]|uniref:Transcriptional regulator, AraC family n=1 Tax=Aliarcobacter cryaerophilus ATCC 43158 TaxID=1032070 RepID=A0AAD0XA26_9BACT|nr:helix-turn-helix domain-containing protein [Aliarcobacter cryaerophilus]AYJ79823.1 transcriptional regulator, AraC family [Aliarcobacter cryaerophilus ATCC 43158]PRM96956.1 hypothetical protein CJ667_07045 [Aliarcobacter cryaerophilus]QCZ24059.1 hypothetical protein AN286_06535 [Aliarcobacter cryaerophilus ATCC 43158]
MNIAILILKDVFKSSAYGIEELFYINNISCKSKDEVEIKTIFVSDEETKYFETTSISNTIYDVVIIPPIQKEEVFDISPKIIDWLIYQYNNRAILSSACIGSFILAKTHLLDGKFATTHWAYEELFKKEYPLVNLDIDKILIDEKNIITVGGVNAYLDLCLYIIEKIHSCKTATQLANLMLIDRGRDSQKSYKAFSTILLFDDEDIKSSISYMKDNIDKQLSILEIANNINLTEKTFYRRFKKALNISPLQYLKILKVEKSKELLISTNKSFSDITFELGYFDENSFRKLFKQETSLNPKDFRKRFQQNIKY